MLELKYIRENKEELIDRLKARNYDATADVSSAIELDEKRRSTQFDLDGQQSELNKLSKEIGILFKSGKQEEANEIKSKTTSLKESIQTLKETMNEVEKELQEVLYKIPNRPNAIVPPGKTDEDNEIIFMNERAKNLENGALPHWELTEKYKLIDFELGVKVTGAGFPIYRGKGARLQRALINFFYHSI